MSSLKYERLRELELALALKDREINVLHNQIDESRASQEGAFNNLVEECLKPGAAGPEALHKVRFEELENATIQLNSVAELKARNAKILRKTAKEAELASFEHEKEHKVLHAKLVEIRALTGMNAAQAEQRIRAQEKDDKNKLDAHRNSEFAIEGGDEFGTESGEGAIVSAESRSRAISLKPQEIGIQKKHLENEIHAMLLIKNQQAKTLEKQRLQIVKRAALNDKRCDVLGEIRQAHHEMAEQKAILQSWVARHDVLDKQTSDFKNNCDHSCKAIMDKNCGTLRNKLEDYVERRRLQDRVIKAQEYRLKQMQDRVKTVQEALVRHGLAQEVEVRIAEAEREAVRAAVANGDASARGASSLIKLPENEEDYYNVDAIVPVEETVHPAIYSLFVQDRDRLQKRVNTHCLMLQDKESALEALEAKIVDLSSSCDIADDQLYDVTVANDRELAEMRQRVAEDLQSHRDVYADLVEANRKNQTTLIKARSRVSSNQSNSSRSGSSMMKK